MADKMDNQKIIKRAIEESFPIVEVNRLAEPERNSFKPIYQMHKWWARRASSVFRAILLGAMKPAGTNIMTEFYKDHGDDPDTNGVTVLDPFMGGGTTIVEALRLGAKAIGIDLNPVAWFIVKTEVEPVDIDELKDAFERLANRKTLSGKPLKEELLSYYKTTCPCCNNEADSVYTFWVKSAICTNPNCKEQVPLFKNYIIAQKSPSIRYFKDCECKTCKTKYDWELDAASLMPFGKLTVNGRKSGGEGRMHARWAYAPEDGKPTCSKCGVENQPITDGKKQRKKVPVHILLCPKCYEVWQYRGELGEEVSCPTCKHTYDPNDGNIPSKGNFICQSCGGTTDKVINSVKKLPIEQLLPTRPYAIEGYCQRCSNKTTQASNKQTNAFKVDAKLHTDEFLLAHGCELTKNNGKFFKKFDENDNEKLISAKAHFEKWENQLVYPRLKIPKGQKTKSDLLGHHYQYWSDMFNKRQLLCLSLIISAISKEKDKSLMEFLLTAFYQTLRNQNRFCFYNPGRSELEPLFSGHDYRNPIDYVENNVWGRKYGRGNFESVIKKVIKGKEFCIKPYDRGQIKGIHTAFRDPVRGEFELSAKSSTILIGIDNKSVDMIITDPPYSDNVNYAELSDFFYVWLRLILKNKYEYFTPEFVPKDDEIIENSHRKKTADDFQIGLTNVFKECNRVAKDNGLLVFTFHHAGDRQWEAVLEAVLESGWEIDSVYPVHGDAFKGGGLGAMLISFDLIHVCKKRINEEIGKKSWAGIRKEIRSKARKVIQEIENNRYGKGLIDADVNVVLIGKCLELYSKHYGSIVDFEGNTVDLQQALKDIKGMVDQLTAKESPFPSELEDIIDTESYIYIRYLAGNKEIQSDSVYKFTKGVLEVDDLHKASLVVRGRAKRGRTFEIKGYSERYTDLLRSLAPDKLPAEDIQATLFPEAEIRPAKETDYFIDKIHFLTGLVANKENVYNWIQKWDKHMPQVRAALKYMIENGARDKDLLVKLNGLISEDLFISQNKE